jgi:hypothetical protein
MQVHNETRWEKTSRPRRYLARLLYPLSTALDEPVSYPGATGQGQPADASRRDDEPRRRPGLPLCVVKKALLLKNRTSYRLC